MTVRMEVSWKQELATEISKPYYRALMDFIQEEYEKNPAQILPNEDQIFRAFDACPFENAKVVILGQDPYPTKGHANGLCFSVAPEVRPLPKSLTNIYKELQADMGIPFHENGDLTRWAEQGVLLLNSVLTVREGEADSHKNRGWEQFTDAVIQKLNERKSDVVYILWGSKAIRKAQNVDQGRNLILTSPHPSPLSAYRGFFGCKHFSQTNAFLEAKGRTEIEW
jgi:uracil-DNA glycosylase